jgi:hypothetical protein
MGVAATLCEIGPKGRRFEITDSVLVVFPMAGHGSPAPGVTKAVSPTLLWRDGQHGADVMKKRSAAST